ncbi:hypothetical protein B0T26DRAFT_106259 [Lasiosphaeria miniovina]|uniref:Uncharacterized protein n=1 Tax=Lasiosphaeria miniovina TaxID=1954250 RepID=A0AA40B3A1_9PEZI|nr:uncharacterized protein B0T26DRAFT_106259 [Lasiosphaeria miniovina]KAK0726869.1 hypothetical protein B0T26DRAFT_106259 [Lasiosphaeria miniovina]
MEGKRGQVHTRSRRGCCERCSASRIKADFAQHSTTQHSTAQCHRVTKRLCSLARRPGGNSPSQKPSLVVPAARLFCLCFSSTADTQLRRHSMNVAHEMTGADLRPLGGSPFEDVSMDLGTWGETLACFYRHVFAASRSILVSAQMWNC